MMRILFIPAAIMLISACAADDDHTFDLSALTPQHRASALLAMDDLNRRYPMRAAFSEGDGPSRMIYVAQWQLHDPRALAEARRRRISFLKNLDGWELAFLNSFATKAPVWGFTEFEVTSHELCHVLGFGHNEIPC